MKKSQNVDMFEKRKENAIKEKQKRKTRNIRIGLVLLFVVLGTTAIYFDKIMHQPLSGTYPVQKEYNPEKLTVLQPRLHYADGQIADQGSAFLINYNGLIYAVTCTHFIDFSGPKVDKVELVEPLSGKVLFTLSECLGNPRNISDSITADFILMPVDVKSTELKKCNILRLHKNNRNLSRSVFLPLKNKKKPINGTLEVAESDFLMYSYKAWHTFSSESGSPLIDSHTNVLEGILARADGQNKSILSPPLNFLTNFLNNNQKFLKLSEMY